MAGALTLRVITPDKIVLDVQTSSVKIPGVDGLIGILPRHAHMVAAVDVGPLTYVEGGAEKGLFVSEGFAEVRNNTLRVVCEAGELPAEIDEKRAKEAEKRARERMGRPKSGGEPVDVLRAEAALRRALMRQHVLGLYARERVRS
ncbi:MAG: ATP synthase F1 subunit epsilon [Planctomycetes bacterium]|nr:ATP synthase F1 subunit epsilon [Planctomycetota bacterium]